MVRIFPRTTRRRVIATLVACSTVLTIAAIPPAGADDLKDRKQRVQNHIEHKKQDLTQSSGRLIAATRELDAAQAKLSAAKQHLAKTRGELAAAEALDRRMQAKLAAAKRALREAREELAEGRKQVGQQEEYLGQIAVANYQQGNPSLLGLSMVLTSQDPATLTSQLNSIKNVLDKESVTLDRLEASKVLLTVKEQEVEKAKKVVAIQRRKAAENLERMKRLEAEAVKAEQRVSALVATRSSARAAARDARAADMAQLQDLRQKEDQISALLRKRAAEARRRAAAAAASARRASGGPLSHPVNGYITSSFGMRTHPIYGYRSLHNGTDFGTGGCGAPILAAASGTVVEMYHDSVYGNRVIIDHGVHRGASLSTWSNHMSGFSTYIGDRVRRGEVIGYVGTTGWSTGCHLHFSVMVNGSRYVNPMSWF